MYVATGTDSVLKEEFITYIDIYNYVATHLL